MKKLLAIIAIGILSSCSKEQSAPNHVEDGLVHYQPTVVSIIKNNCYTCHNEQASIPMTNFNEVQLLVINGSLKACLNGTINPNTADFYYHKGFPNLDSNSKKSILDWINDECPQ